MGEFVDLGGVKTWFETAGDTGEPVVLLHGGLATAETWGMQTTAFAESFRVFVPERRAHGRTQDVEGPLTYEVMAEDTIAFLDAVVGEPAHLVGWSDGGNVGLLVALRRPDLVRKLVAIGSNYDTKGLDAAFLEFAGVDPGDPGLAMFRGMYESVSPDGAEHWPVAFAKIRDMWMNFHINVEDLGRISCPALVMVGDDDVVQLEHTISLYRSIPVSELAIVPGASHALLMEKSALANSLISDFLRNDPVATFFPVRRATSVVG